MWGVVALLLFELDGGVRDTRLGVLIAVPVMLLVVRIVNQGKGWYEHGASHG